MKAWQVIHSDDWCTLMHAETRGQAITAATNHVSYGDEFTEFRALRLPGLDDKPITYENAKAAGFEYEPDRWFDCDADQASYNESIFSNDCPCEICKTAQN